jgi:hypothetical protein
MSHSIINPEYPFKQWAWEVAVFFIPNNKSCQIFHIRYLIQDHLSFDFYRLEKSRRIRRENCFIVSIEPLIEMVRNLTWSTYVWCCSNRECINEVNRDHDMIELKGKYYDTSNRNPLAVLVQYDGQMLHVWHLSDPFYRLRSGSEFMVKSMKNRGQIIKFSDGSCIETENNDALNLIIDKLNRVKALKLKSFYRSSSIVGGIFLIMVAIFLCWATLT